MEAKIKQEVGKQNLSAVKVLNLTKFKSNNIVGLSEDLKNLEELSITNVGLQSLKGFPNLTNLKKLALSGNEISDGLDALTSLPKLAELNLSGNKIKDVDSLQPLVEISTLKKLQLSGCDICQTKDYKEKVFKLIKSLTSLDGSSDKKNGKEDHEEEELDEEEEVLDEEDEEEIEGEDESLDEEELDDEEDENEIPLETLYNKTLEEGDDEEDEDFEAVEDEDDEDIEDEEGDEETIANMSKENVDGPRGKKRKLDAPKESESKK